MEIGVDSFASGYIDEQTGEKITNSERMRNLVDQIVLADQVGLDVFGVGEHHRRDFLDSAPAVILAAAAARTNQIRLNSAVTVLSSADPVRVFQEFATLDLISRGRAEIIAGRGSFKDSFPLFGFALEDYDALFVEKLDLLLKIRESEFVTWRGKYRSALTNQGIYPRPYQQPIPVWLGVGGSKSSFGRAGELGLPLYAAIIAGHMDRFQFHVQLYRDNFKKFGHSAETLKFGVHAFGYVSETTEKAVAEFFPGWEQTMNALGVERGWEPEGRAEFDDQQGPDGVLMVGGPEYVAEKIIRFSDTLGGIDRLTFQMSAANLTHKQMMNSIELIGTKVAPALRSHFA